MLLLGRHKCYACIHIELYLCNIYSTTCGQSFFETMLTRRTQSGYEFSKGIAENELKLLVHKWCRFYYDY